MAIYYALKNKKNGEFHCKSPTIEMFQKNIVKMHHERKAMQPKHIFLKYDFGEFMKSFEAVKITEEQIHIGGYIK